MKQRFALLLAGGLLALSPVAASAQSAPPPARNAVPPFEVLTMLRSTAFEPIGRPTRTGSHYVVRAVDRYGEEVRVVVDAYNGRIRTVTPTGEGPRYAAPAAPGPYYGPPGFYGPGPYYGPGRMVRVLPEDDDEIMPSYRPYPGDPRMAPPRVSPPQTKAAQRPPLPRSRPAQPAAAQAPVEAAPPAPVQAAPEPAPEPAAAPAPAGDTPPPQGFE